jgi:aspartate/tyrosine/aromatic aminotransferase
MPQDAILRLIAEYKNDKRDDKIDLGVGVYRDADGKTPILRSVKKAERFLLESQQTKAYLGSSGCADFNAAIQRLTFGDEAGQSDRIMTLQTPGGSGSLRVAAGLLLRAREDTTVWAGEPTWNNHMPLLGSAGIRISTLPFYDRDSNVILFDEMLDAIKTIPAGDILLLHGCCHNPTGMDFSRDQWRALATILAERDILPFIDLAYQGFAEGLEEDRFGVETMFESVPEIVVSSSCSKNFALYRDRVGSLSVVAKNVDTVAVLRSQANNIVRTMYSMPPDHGAAVVEHILGNDELRDEWQQEVTAMRERLVSMRSLLVSALQKYAPSHDFSHIESANGMFSFLGIAPARVEALKSDFGIYMEGSSRINVAGISSDNVDYLARSIAAVL